MNVSRRQFFKLVAAGAAVAFVPLPATEIVAAAAAAPEPVSVGTTLHKSLWRVMGMDTILEPNSLMMSTLHLNRGRSYLDVGMYFDSSWPDLFVNDEIEIEIKHFEGLGKQPLQLFSSGQPIPGVKYISGWDEKDFIDITHFNDKYVPFGELG